MESKRKLWNSQQQEFRRILLSFEQHEKAIELFLSQHAALHSAGLTQAERWTYEDEILDDMTEPQIRRIPRNYAHSVAWTIWHIARIEDVTMNLLVAGTPQVLQRDQWLEPLNITIRHTGNAMAEAEVAQLSATIDIEALRAYRLAVGRRTREIGQQLQAETLEQKVEPARLQQIRTEGAVVEAASGLLDYWGKRTIAGLLLMPATRHNFVHLNEAARLKGRPE